VLSRVPRTTPAEFSAAVAAARAAFPGWRATPPAARARVMFRFQALIRAHAEELAAIVTAEQGKTLADARGDVLRGLEVVEAACAVPRALLGEAAEDVAAGVDTVSLRQPLGVVAAITPFNFPAMVPLWSFPIAVAAGNTFILKPSERVPGAAMRLAALAAEAGLPPGVLNVVHGGAETVNALCDAPDVAAVSFVGSSAAAAHVYARAGAAGKRCQANGGAKNHAVVMPDAEPERVAAALAGAAFGAAGQRCMAISAAVFVGGMAEPVRAALARRARALRVGAGREPGVDVGPMISRRARARAEALVAAGLARGARALVDGRGVEVSGYPDGNFLGPTILTGVTTDMAVYNEEVFGPVLSCLEVDSLGAALALVNASPYGNGAAIFTRGGAAARRFAREVECGMVRVLAGLDRYLNLFILFYIGPRPRLPFLPQVGVNVPIPVPVPLFSFTGWKGSFHGDLQMYGEMAARFYTRTKTVTSAWREEGGGGEGGGGSRGGATPGLAGVGASAH
jgi:malonate-semialdehyde dehydrogenase (acetylating)/methylmalonate-semialdehyde dehydrogenase